MKREQKKKQLLEELSKSLPQLEGTIAVKGLEKEVRILRDKWGVPHIFAENNQDLFFAQGYTHAQDRLWQMEFFRFLSSGRLCELVGTLTLDLDIFARTLGLRRAAEKELELVKEKGDPRITEMMEAYMEGVNEYIKTHQDDLPPEFSIVNHKPEPFTALDLVTFSKFLTFLLNGNMGLELLRAQLMAKLGAKRTKQLMPFISDTSTTVVPSLGSYTDYIMMRDKYKEIFPWTRTMGSNNWVVNGKKTTTGKPMLANDPHLLTMMPSIWYENHLVSDELNLYGVIFAGAPGIVIGFNGTIAWGCTVCPCDTQDWYVEKINPKNPHQYEYNGKWEDAEVVVEKFNLSKKKIVEKEIVITRHGPLFDFMLVSMDLPFESRKIDRKLALRWTGHDPSNTLQAFLGVCLSKNWQEFREALSRFGYASQNFVYADVEGNIGYQTHGRIPIRKKGSGLMPVPGWTDEYEWEGYIPFDELPSAFNPPTNYFATANNKTIDDDYPYHITHDWTPPYRARRIVELLTAKEKLTIDDFKRIQGDSVSIHARESLPLMLKMKPENKLQEEAIKYLKNWDFDLSRESTAAAIFEMWYHHLLINLLENILGKEILENFYLKKQSNNYDAFGIPRVLQYPENYWIQGNSNSNTENLSKLLSKSLQDALETLQKMLGEDMSSWAWGKIHIANFAHPLGIIPPYDLVLNVMGVPTAGDENTINNGIFNPTMDPKTGFHQVGLPSTRFIMDLSNFSNSVNMHTTGQSGHPASKHYNDMCYPWANIEYHKVLYDKELIEKEAEMELKLVPK